MPRPKFASRFSGTFSHHAYWLCTCDLYPRNGNKLLWPFKEYRALPRPPSGALPALQTAHYCGCPQSYFLMLTRVVIRLLIQTTCITEESEKLPVYRGAQQLRSSGLSMRFTELQHGFCEVRIPRHPQGNKKVCPCQSVQSAVLHAVAGPCQAVRCQQEPKWLYRLSTPALSYTFTKKASVASENCERNVRFEVLD
jgi:hypothetical protein